MDDITARMLGIGGISPSHLARFVGFVWFGPSIVDPWCIQLLTIDGILTFN
jgi:hypothetical protein